MTTLRAQLSAALDEHESAIRADADLAATRRELTAALRIAAACAEDLEQLRDRERGRDDITEERRREQSAMLAAYRTVERLIRDRLKRAERRAAAVAAVEEAQPFCACGRRLSECDSSRVACGKGGAR
jgi:hypothetical protein